MKRSLNNLGAVPMLTHFTRAAQKHSALDNVVSILSGGVIRGANRMIRGGRSVVCLFDAPMGELSRLLVRDNRRRYEPFGIAVDKRYAFTMGARPVIYMPWREAERMLNPEEVWRVVSIDFDQAPPIDWSFEREWRLLGDLTLPLPNVVALVETWNDADEIYERFDGNPPCAGVIPLKDLFGLP